MIIAIAHQKGGVGKSAIAWHLSQILRPDLIVDLDFQQSITNFNMLRQQNGKDPLPVKRLDTETELKNIIDNDHDNQLVVIDLGGFDSDFGRMAIATADLVVTPIYDLPTEILGLVEFKNILNQIGDEVGESINAHVLVNKVHHSRRQYADINDAVLGLGLQMMTTKIVESRSIAESVGEGLSLMEFKSSSKHRAISCFNRLSDEVRELLAS